MSAKAPITDRGLPGSGAWRVRAVVVTGLLLLAILVLAPLFQTGFTTRDDAETGLLPDQWGGWWGAVWALTLASGRFFHVISLHLVFALSRLCSRHPIAYHLLATGSVLLNVAGFYFVTARALASKAAGVLAAACALTWLQNGWNHNLLTSYPVLPHLGLTILLGIVILLLAWQRTPRPGATLIAGAAYFAALLVSEAFVVYLPVLLALCLYRAWHTPDRSLGERVRAATRSSSPMIVALAIYLICYFVFRHFYPSHHYGNQLAPFDFRRTALVIWQYGLSTFPGYFYFRDSTSLNVTIDGVATNSGWLWQLFARIRPEWIAKALIANLFCWLVLSRRRHFFAARSFVLAVVTAIACLVAPVLLVGLTRQYQDWVVNSNSLAYGAPSYFAYFAMVFMIVVVMLGLGQCFMRWPFAWRLYVVLACCFVTATSLATDYYNHYITLDQQLSHLKWRTVDRFIATETYGKIPAGSVIYAPSLWRGRGIMANSDFYWTEYFSQWSGKRVSLHRSAEEFKAALNKTRDANAYYLGFEQEATRPNQSLVFGELKKPAEIGEDGTAYADTFILFTYSKIRKFTLMGTCSGDTATFEVNGRRLEDVDGGVFFASIDHEPTPGDFPATTVRSSAPIDLTRLVISYLPSELRPNRLEIRYGPGFYGGERDPASGDSWNWSAAESTWSVINNSSQNVESSLRFTLTTLTPRSVTLRMSGSAKTFTLEGGGSKVVELAGVVLQPGENKFFFRSDRPAQLVGNGDPRPIAFGVRNLVVAHPVR
jgi:hypothetical protein